MRVLVLDDDDGMRAILKVMLSRRGFNPLEASDGKQAWKILSRHQVPIIISDWVMPGGTDGLNFCRRIRKRFKARPVIFFMLTGRRRRLSDYYLARQSGVDDFFFKPIDFTALGNRLEDARRQVMRQRQAS